MWGDGERSRVKRREEEGGGEGTEELIDNQRCRKKIKTKGKLRAWDFLQKKNSSLEREERVDLGRQHRPLTE